MLALLLLANLLPPPRQAPNVIEPGPTLYPPAALAAGLHGDVAVHLDIAADGAMRSHAEAAEALASLNGQAAR